MKRSQVALAMTVSAALAVGVVPASMVSAAAPSPPPAGDRKAVELRGDAAGLRALTVAQLAAALPAYTDAPAGLRANESEEPYTAKNDRPESCLLNKVSAPVAPRAATAVISTDEPGREKVNTGVAVQASIWQYPARKASKVSSLRKAFAACNGTRVVTQGKEKLRILSTSKLSGNTVTQYVSVHNVKRPAQRQHASIRWQLHGRNLVMIAVDRYGLHAKKVSAKRAAKDLGYAKVLVSKTIRKLQVAHLEPATTSATEAPVDQSNAQEFDQLVSSSAATPGSWAVSLGDSYISGEGGQWAGNVFNRLDASIVRTPGAMGDNPYADQGNHEAIKNCHRSKSAEIHIGTVANALNSLNLACSGAETNSAVLSKGAWKPGIDFHPFPTDPSKIGQAEMLSRFASQNNVETVTLSIGGNDVKFGSIVERCVKDFLFSSYVWKTYCSEAGEVKAKITDENMSRIAGNISTAITNIRKAMRDAGYADDAWKLVVQTYPSPIPSEDRMRPWQTILRHSDEGCGFWDKDATWANRTLLPKINNAVREGAKRSGLTNLAIMDLEDTLIGHRLCDTGVRKFIAPYDRVLSDGQIRHQGEWVQQIVASGDVIGPMDKQESLHPNSWGQLAFRNCLRQMVERATFGNGTCVRVSDDLTANGEPTMQIK